MPNSGPAGVITSTESGAPRHVAAGFGRDDRSNLQYGTSIQIRTVRRADGDVLVVLNGELDITSMELFDRTLAEVVAAEPKRVTFDLTGCDFVSVQGYEAMGRCSARAEVEIRSTTALAARVLALYGYADAVRVVLEEATSECHADPVAGAL